MNDHLQGRLPEHLTVIFSKLKSLQDRIGELPSGGQTVSVTVYGRMHELERKCSSLQLELERTGHRKTNSAAGELPSAPAAAALLSKSAADSSTVPALTAEKMPVIEGVITVLNREMEKMTVDMEGLERQRRMERELIDNMDRKVRSMERLIAMKDATINELNIRLTSVEQTSYDGTLLWRVSEVQKKRQEAVTGGVTSVYSPPFFTSRTGRLHVIHIYSLAVTASFNKLVDLF